MMGLFFLFVAAVVGVQVQTSDGPVIGRTVDNVNVFQGLPFAAPPVGALRWAAPQAPAPWTSPYNASGWGNICPQTVMGGYDFPPSATAAMDEDCLNLDVYAPSSASAGSLPVFVWFYGGGLHQGSANEFRLDGSNLARKGDVVIVAGNYRLGALGFLAHEGLKDQGCFGIMDQQFLLHWVQTNIAKFGGDPTNVVIGGESAGGTSTSFHLIAPGSRGLFHRAIVESAALGEGKPLEETLAVWQPMETLLNCTSLECLREARWEDVLTAQLAALKANLGNAPCTVGNASVVPLPYEAYRQNKAANVPLLAGNVANEGTLFTQYLEPKHFNVVEYLFALGELCKKQKTVNVSCVDFAYEVHKQYPCHSLNCGDAFTAFFGDAALVCPTNYVLHHMAAAPVYAYEWAHRPSWTPPRLKVFHSSEVIYVFDNLKAAFPNSTVPPAEQAVADYMSTEWLAFIKTGKPASADWPLFNASNGFTRALLNSSITFEEGWKEESCSFLGSLGFFHA